MKAKGRTIHKELNKASGNLNYNISPVACGSQFPGATSLEWRDTTCKKCLSRKK